MMHHLKRVTLQRGKFPTGDQYPFTLPLFRQTECLSFDTPVTFFSGENGTGKSTLLEALARACGIHIWSNNGDMRYQHNPYEKRLHHYLDLAWANGRVPGAFFGSDIFRDFTRRLDAWAAFDPGLLEYFGGSSLETQSHGQGMMSYFRSRYKIKGLYLLDEPETALSPRSQLELLEIIGNSSRAGHAQFIIATHSPILLACAGAVIYSFDGGAVGKVEYEETEHYRIYKSFLEDRSKFLKSH